MERDGHMGMAQRTSSTIALHRLVSIVQSIACCGLLLAGQTHHGNPPVGG